MRWKITISLIFLNIIVFYGILYFQKHSHNKHIETRNVLGTDIIDIDKIEIINKAFKEPRILERQNGQWKITSPIEWPANLFAIQRIITQLQFLIHEARLPTFTPKMYIHYIGAYSTQSFCWLIH